MWMHHQQRNSSFIAPHPLTIRYTLAFAATYWTNPQFKIRLDEADDGHEGSASEPCCTVLLGLMQKNRRRQKRMGEGLLSIGYSLYQVPKELENQTDVHLSRDFFSMNRPVARSDTYVNLRGVSNRFQLPQGEYLIVPSTFEPFKDGEFCLRVFSEKQAKAQLQGAEFQFTKKRERKEDCELTANELQTILNRVITKRTDIKSDGFNINTCREMISLLDEVYKKVDTDYSGTIDAHEMRNALKEAGFTLNNTVQHTIALRYACSKLTIDFDGFLACMIRLETLFKMFQMLDKDKNGVVQLSLAEVKMIK
ncbi:hypothetical protein JD844_025172 [Phrynosoma platyrhinos]|uniref:EF-hand domain-containing protein n=1 Tax=Phrynosoma platyrhinos TaxID=52577 RepID=A0ABQ7SZG1_PHRPL|nr:hypothetical protein JD844_025172 [Phrynosoma platyrhinos]